MQIGPTSRQDERYVRKVVGKQTMKMIKSITEKKDRKKDRKKLSNVNPDHFSDG